MQVTSAPDLPTALASETFAASMKALEHAIEELAATATEIELFWLRQDHPAYPVFWD